MATSRRKVLICSPFAFTPRYKMFPEFIIGEKLHQDELCQVTFASNRIAGTRPRSSFCGITTLRLPHLFFGNHKPWSLLKSFVSSFLLLCYVRPNLLVVNHLRSGCFPLAWFAKIFRIKTVLCEAGILHDEYITNDRDDPLNQRILKENILRDFRQVLGRGPTKRRLFNVLRHWPWYNVSRVLFYSGHNLEIAREIGIPPERLGLLRLYINTTHLAALDDGELNETELRELEFGNKKVVFLICQLKLRKGYDIFLQVAKEICSARNDTVFILGSASRDAKAIARIEEFIEVNQLQGRLLFLRNLSNRARNFLYERADLYLMPSRYEGFGLPAIEAGWGGALVVASDVPALNEFLVDGENSLLFDPSDLSSVVDRTTSALQLDPREFDALKAAMIETCLSYDINRVENYTQKFWEAVQ